MFDTVLFDTVLSPCSNAAEGYGQHSNIVTDGVWMHANTCEGVSYINLELLTVLYMTEHFGTVSYPDILCSIVLYPSFFPRPYRAITMHGTPFHRTFWNEQSEWPDWSSLELKSTEESLGRKIWLNTGKEKKEEYLYGTIHTTQS